MMYKDYIIQKTKKAPEVMSSIGVPYENIERFCESIGISFNEEECYKNVTNGYTGRCYVGDVLAFNYNLNNPNCKEDIVDTDGNTYRILYREDDEYAYVVRNNSDGVMNDVEYDEMIQVENAIYAQQTEEDSFTYEFNEGINHGFSESYSIDVSANIGKVITGYTLAGDPGVAVVINVENNSDDEIIIQQEIEVSAYQNGVELPEVYVIDEEALAYDAFSVEGGDSGERSYAFAFGDESNIDIEVKRSGDGVVLDQKVLVYRMDNGTEGETENGPMSVKDEDDPMPVEDMVLMSWFLDWP